MRCLRRVEASEPSGLFESLSLGCEIELVEEQLDPFERKLSELDIEPALLLLEAVESSELPRIDVVPAGGRGLEVKLV